MSEQHPFIATGRDLAARTPRDHLAERRRAVRQKLETWLERADFILAERKFDLAAALKLVLEIRTQMGPGFLGLAAGQALASLQAANMRATDTWQSDDEKQRLELVRNALADQACSS
jgi:hypothetical protein